jgi:hypothetical protein
MFQVIEIYGVLGEFKGVEDDCVSGTASLRCPATLPLLWKNTFIGVATGEASKTMRTMQLRSTGKTTSGVRHDTSGNMRARVQSIAPRRESALDSVTA